MKRLSGNLGFMALCLLFAGPSSGQKPSASPSPANKPAAVAPSPVSSPSPKASATSSPSVTPAPLAGSPTEAVRNFYQALRQKRLREAFDMSIYRAAIEKLSAEEFEDLRPDFEHIAANVPDKFDVTGEEISGDSATVFIKTNNEEGEHVDAQPLIREDGRWIVGDKEDEAKVQKAGKNFFFDTRIEVHQADVKAMMLRIANAEFAFSVKNGGVYADLGTLVEQGLVPKDIETSETTGYNFHVESGKKGKGYVAHAEPERYNRTGRLSFYMDKSGLRSKDAGGKPLNSAKK